jgi:hypothetical protein
VVDAEAAGVDEHGPDRLAEGLEPGRSELPRDVRRQAPVLALRPELVRRRADAAAEGQQVLVGPTVEAPGLEPDGEVLQHGDAALGCRGPQLPVDQPLAPGVEAEPLLAHGGRSLGHRGSVRSPQLVGPGPPRRPVHLGHAQ